MANVRKFGTENLSSTRKFRRGTMRYAIPIRSAIVVAAMLLSGSADAGWVCIAKSSYGTHATTTTWSESAASRSGAEGSAIGKCVSQAVNKRDCRVQRCWSGG